MNSSGPKSRRLSQLDSFFVAYQESSGILMQLGVEVELKGKLRRTDLEEMLSRVVANWPQLGQVVRRNLLGLSWSGDFRVNEMLQVGCDRNALIHWRNQPLNPFHEPPFQLMWIPADESNVLAFRAHHSVMDGQAFFGVCVEAVRTLADVITRSKSHSIKPAVGVNLTHVIGPGRLLREGKFPNMLRYARNLTRESRADRSARLVMRACVPGNTAIAERTLEKEEYRRLKQLATAKGIPPAWICAAAWIKSIHAWNSSFNKHSNPIVSLETPVSLRRRQHRDNSVGNFISPLVLFSDANLPLDELAQDLKKQLMNEIRRRSHLAVPLLTAPAKYLPWSLFRRLSTSSSVTGFATSHFTWFEQDGEIHSEVQRASSGALQITGQRIYTPVCLHMGAALSVLTWPDRAQISLTYRETAFSQSEAGAMLDQMIAELGDSYANRQQVAV